MVYISQVFKNRVSKPSPWILLSKDDNNEDLCRIMHCTFIRCPYLKLALIFTGWSPHHDRRYWARKQQADDHGSPAGGYGILHLHRYKPCRQGSKKRIRHYTTWVFTNSISRYNKFILFPSTTMSFLLDPNGGSNISRTTFPLSTKCFEFRFNNITRNERKVGCAIIYKDTIHYAI